DAFLACRLELEAAHDAGEVRGLAVVTPAHRLVVREGQERSHLAVLDGCRHVAAVIGGGAHVRLLIALVSMRLHAVTVLPGREVAKRHVVEEVLVFGYEVGRDIAHNYFSGLRQTLELLAWGGVGRKTQ